jgi:hypothetical protein
MSELIYDKVLRESIKELIGEPDNLQPFAERIFNNHTQNIATKAQLYVRSGGKIEDIAEELVQESKDSLNSLVEAFINSAELKDSLYKKTYDRLKQASGSKSWVDIFSEIYADECSLNEIFVRLVEEKQGVEITSTKQLQELTGITEMYGYWDEEKEEVIPGDKILTKKEAQELAAEQIEDTFIKAMSYRYSKTLEDMLNAGAKYKDLLEIKPKDFNLPETWSGCLSSDQHSSILWAIESVFKLGEPNSSVRPDLKTVAIELAAPYSILMDTNKICNHCY